ncbi:hypothetical protein GCM10011586_22640 [Silvibacterium dinghuense]|nr:hypothetical protein GCM10011586_22640 [Silvibacterium dinghuense]
MDPAGPTISLQNSEALFDVAVALNACGYDAGLEQSDPIRLRVRQQVNEMTQQSADARDARDKICSFIDQHRLSGASRDLSQYVSLALFLNPPPELSPSVDEEEMPPDSTQVENIWPLLRDFVQKAQLHVIWVEDHAAYDALISQFHDPLTKMIVDTNAYLKIPASTYDGRRFLVVLEPLLSPAETNARVYGADYVVVVSPANGTIRMDDVRHTYLHYQLEPLLYARSTAMDRLLPFLKVVKDAPLDFVYRSDIVSLVIESMIRAIEARTMETGVVIHALPSDTERPDMEAIFKQHNAEVQKDAQIRQQSVSHSMSLGFVLTQYFYNQLINFEKSPESFQEAIGEMVYGMPVDEEINRAKNVRFVEEGSTDVIARTPRQPRGLDLAELDLIKGDATSASSLAQKALDQKTGDPARANFILARADLVEGHMDDAEKAFRETVRLSQDPRMSAWSHIYLGRILDVEEERDQAVAEYKAALTVRDGQPDTKAAAEKGVKAPFTLPKHEESDSDAEDDGKAPAKPQGTASPDSGSTQAAPQNSQPQR